VSVDEQLKAQEFFSKGYIYPKTFKMSGVTIFVLSNGITTKKVTKEIFEFIKGLEQ